MQITFFILSKLLNSIINKFQILLINNNIFNKNEK